MFVQYKKIERAHNSPCYIKP